MQTDYTMRSLIEWSDDQSLGTSLITVGLLTGHLWSSKQRALRTKITSSSTIHNPPKNNTLYSLTFIQGLIQEESPRCDEGSITDEVSSEDIVYCQQLSIITNIIIIIVIIIQHATNTIFYLLKTVLN